MSISWISFVRYVNCKICDLSLVSIAEYCLFYQINEDFFVQVMRPGGMESFQVVLKSQILHKNALVAGVLQAHICTPVKVKEFKRSVSMFNNISLSYLMLMTTTLKDLS